MDLLLPDIENFLDKTVLTYQAIEEQIINYKLVFPKYYNDTVEYKEKFPMFNISFYNYIEIYQRIPTQDEFISHWFDENKNNATLLKYTNDDDVRYGLECRIKRLYPSLVRDIHFSLLLKSKVKSGYIFYDKKMDIENDIDVGIVVNNNIYALNLFIDTDRSNSFRAKKVYRHSRFDNVNYIEYPKKRTTSTMVGSFYLYGIPELKDINEKLKQIAK